MSLVTLSSVTKSYRNYSSQYKRVATFFGFPFSPVSETTILSDISFSINRGEAVAIVGQNGAGKSTLLKLITGTLYPTSGSIHVKGKVAAILELGMGFNPDFTGRQNAFHSASLMGHSADSIAKAMPYIKEFAEIGDYFDMPTRIYSSGMQMRLAFAVATAFLPDLLIIDEALSVGDTYFQHKSFERIREFKEKGVSLLFVSHDRAAVQAVCDRALLLVEGKVALDATPQEVFDYYNALIAKKEETRIHTKALSSGHLMTLSGTGEARILEVLVLDSAGRKLTSAAVGQKLILQITVIAEQEIDSLVVGFMIKDRLGQVLFGTNTYHTDDIVHGVKKGEKIKFDISFDALFGEGSYSVTVALTDTYTHLSKNYEWRDFAAMFDVHNDSKPQFVGSQFLDIDISIQREEP